MKMTIRGTWMLALASLGFALLGTLTACDKTQKSSTAGGGSSTQSVFSVKGAAR